MRSVICILEYHPFPSRVTRFNLTRFLCEVNELSMTFPRRFSVRFLQWVFLFPHSLGWHWDLPSNWFFLSSLWIQWLFFLWHFKFMTQLVRVAVDGITKKNWAPWHVCVRPTCNGLTNIRVYDGLADTGEGTDFFVICTLWLNGCMKADPCIRTKHERLPGRAEFAPFFSWQLAIQAGNRILEAKVGGIPAYSFKSMDFVPNFLLVDA